MEWIPIVFVTFKVLVLGTGMFYAIKWHYDQGKKRKGTAAEKGSVLRAAFNVAVVFVIALLVLGFVAYFLLNMLGNDLTFP